jgi:hypothetical protein
MLSGAREWRAYRELIDLFGSPVDVERFAPRWPILFGDLAARSTEELLLADGEWLASLAVGRAERAEEDEFRAVFVAQAKASGSVQPLAGCGAGAA